MTRKKGDGKAADTRYQSPLESQRRATQQQTVALHLTVLQRIDPSVMEIVNMTTTTPPHVAVFRFDLRTAKWVKIDCEGSLFVVRRTSGHRLFVLNRCGIENYEQDISAATSVQIDRPYLILRPSAEADVIGMWFYDEQQHASVSRLVQELVEMCKNGGVPSPLPPTVPMAHRPPLPPQAPATSAADQAGADLRGMLGIGGGAPAAPPPVDVGATSDLMSMLNIGGAASDPVQIAPPPQHMHAPQPPSPGANIMAMLGVNVGGATVVEFPGPSQQQQQQQQQQPALGGAGGAGGAGGGGGVQRPTAAELLKTSVAKTFGGSTSVAPMTRAQFQQSLQAAVDDDAFVNELYRQHLAPDANA